MGNCCGGGFKKKKAKSAALQETVWLDPPHLKLGPGQTLREGFIVSQEALGRGRTAIVWSGVERVTGKQVAIKRCSKKNLGKRRVAEVEILLRLQSGEGCAALPRLLGTYEDPKRLYLVTPLCQGGDLYAYVARSAAFCEQDASAVAGQLVVALAHLHRHRVVHRDLKPENVLFEEEGGSRVQLVDLGSALPLPPCDSLAEPGGGGFFCAPEVHGQQRYTVACDMWSLGALLLVLLGGAPPPTSRDVHATPAWLKLSVGQVDWLPEHTSPALEDLLRRLLTPHVAARLSAEDALKHPWISQRACLRRQPLAEAIAGAREHVAERTRLLQESRCFYVQENNRSCAIRRTSEVPEQMEAWRRAKPVKGGRRDPALVEVNRQLMPVEKGSHGGKFFVEVLPRKTHASAKRRHAYEECERHPDPPPPPADRKRSKPAAAQKAPLPSNKSKLSTLFSLKAKRQ